MFKTPLKFSVLTLDSTYTVRYDLSNFKYLSHILSIAREQNKKRNQRLLLLNKINYVLLLQAIATIHFCKSRFKCNSVINCVFIKNILIVCACCIILFILFCFTTNSMQETPHFRICGPDPESGPEYWHNLYMGPSNYTANSFLTHAKKFKMQSTGSNAAAYVHSYLQREQVHLYPKQPGEGPKSQCCCFQL